ncbi:MAG: hypothetical protein HY518_01220 [Candidatus Aenigmarchaeota archaeon]|nr:hypothetical protein [Candidatus Aenigmarchaeota archaeon]
MKQEIFIAGLRISLGWIYLWAFLDKLLGLGFATKADKSWLAGGSPTSGFLQFGVHGPLAPLFSSLAGNAAVDGLFMAGLLLIGLAIMLGIGMRIASWAGVLLSLLMWSSLLPPANNPTVDEHIIYVFAFLVLASIKAGHAYGLGKWWSERAIVKKHPILE